VLSANTLVRWVNENAFAPIVRARPDPTFGRPVHLRDGSLDYGPVLLLMPFGSQLTVDTLPSGKSASSPASEVISPAFGYDAPHLSIRGTSTLLNSALLSAHYGQVRLLRIEHRRLWLVAFPTRTTLSWSTRRSLSSQMKVVRMPGSLTTRDPARACDGAQPGVAFRHYESVGIPDRSYSAAQWLAYTHLCQHFARTSRSVAHDSRTAWIANPFAVGDSHSSTLTG